MSIRAVIFDAGNTLVEMDYATIARAIVMAGGSADADAVREAERRARIPLNEHLGQGSTETDETRWLYLGLVLDGLASPPREPDSVQEAIAAYGNPWRVADPDAGPTLSILREAGYRLGVVSNSDGTVERILDRMGLGEHLEVVIDSARVDVEKPDPRIFRLALDVLEVPPAEAVYVGDLPAVDGAGARAAGLRFVLMDPLGLWPDDAADFRVRRLLDLPSLLPRM